MRINSKNTVMFILGAAFAASLAMVYGFYSIMKTPSLSLLDHLFQENVSYQFQSYAAKISGKQSLQVARLEQIEVIERTSQTRALWLNLPPVVTRLQVPVEYNFYVSVNVAWDFARTQTELIVHVPEISSGTPAANISQMKLEVTSGNFLFNESTAKQKLQQEVHTILVDNSIAYRAKVREQAREAIRDFVEVWLSQQQGGRGQTPVPVRIYFPGEELPRPKS